MQWISRRSCLNDLYFFRKKSTSSGGVKNYNMSNQQLAKELYKPIVKSFEKREVYSSLIDNIWEADLADM